MSNPEPSVRIEVDAEALQQVLQALVGPGYLIRELQATRDKPPLFTGNPIDTLVREYNEAIRKLEA